MSLILEALRKSEAERRRGHAPDVAMELPPPALRMRRAMPPWAWPVAIAATLALGSAWWWSQRDKANTPAGDIATTTDAATGEQQAPAAPVVVARNTPPAPPLATPAAVPAPVATPPARGITPITYGNQELAEPPPAAAAPVAAPPPPDDVPTAALPSVKLSMHMWDEAPAKRFVILNGQRMGEGERSGDLLVVAIERNGVVVDRNGQRTRIPLP